VWRVQSKFVGGDKPGVQRQDVEHGLVVVVGEAARGVLDENGVVAHVRRPFDRGGDHVLDALPADVKIPDIVGGENTVEVGAFKTIRAVIDHDQFVRSRLERIDDIDLPAADDALVFVLGALQQRVVLVFRELGKAGAPADDCGRCKRVISLLSLLI